MDTADVYKRLHQVAGNSDTSCTRCGQAIRSQTDQCWRCKSLLSVKSVRVCKGLVGEQIAEDI